MRSLGSVSEAWGPLACVHTALRIRCSKCVSNEMAFILQVPCGQHEIVLITRGGESARRGQVRGWHGEHVTSGTRGRTFVTAREATQLGRPTETILVCMSYLLTPRA